MRATVLASSFVCVGLGAQQEVPIAASIRRIEMAVRSAPPPVLPVRETVALGAEAPRGVAAPDGWLDARFGALTVGGRSIAFAVGRSGDAAKHSDVLCVDLDGDGAFADGERLALEVTENVVRGKVLLRGKEIDAAFPFARRIDARFCFLQPADGAPTIAVQFPAYLHGDVTLAGKAHVVAVIDKDLDGAFGSAGDLWALTSPGAAPVATLAMSTLGERRFADGNLVSLRFDARGAATLQVEASRESDAASEAAHRLRVERFWSDRFDEERARFVEERKLDASRPRAARPVEWHHVPFDAAIELGRKAGKPVVVDVMAFWCVWCYRLDYYTYCDAEVAKVLSERFVPVKILQEQDRAGDFERIKRQLDATGIPAIGVFGTDGRLLHKVVGWQSPVALLAELETALAAAKAQKQQ